MFDPQAYGEEVASILALDGDGERLHAAGAQAERREPGPRAGEGGENRSASARGAVPVFRLLEGGAHETAQDIDTAEGSYWHAIVHRQEPDAGNAGYWFRQVGAHAIFPELRARAAEIGMPTGARWDPIAFIEYCGRATQGSDEERIAQEVQRAEWQLLFAWCAK